MDIAVPFIAGWDGKRNQAYRDIAGVVTICYGSTRGVQIGQHMTGAECLASRSVNHRRRLGRTSSSGKVDDAGTRQARACPGDWTWKRW